MFFSRLQAIVLSARLVRAVSHKKEMSKLRMNRQEQEKQEFTATCYQYTCQSLAGYSFGLVLGIPPLILANLGRSALATVPCGSASPSLLPAIGIILYLGEMSLILLLILVSIFWQKTRRPFIFGIGLGLLTMIIPLLLTGYGVFLNGWQRCFHVEF